MGSKESLISGWKLENFFFRLEAENFGSWVVLDVLGWLWMVLCAFASFWVLLGGFRWFLGGFGRKTLEERYFRPDTACFVRSTGAG